MSQTIIAVVVGALLFALFGLFPARSCDGHCSGCGASCDRFAGKRDRHVI